MRCSSILPAPQPTFRLSTLYRQAGRTADATRELEEYQKYKDMKEKLEQLYHEMRDQTGYAGIRRDGRAKIAAMGSMDTLRFERWQKSSSPGECDRAAKTDHCLRTGVYVALVTILVFGLAPVLLFRLFPKRCSRKSLGRQQN